MNSREVPAVDDYRDLVDSLGVAQSATEFACPNCSARSFVVLHVHPMEVECLKCGTVAPFSVTVGYAGNPGGPRAWTPNDRPAATTDYHAA
jgi:ribosomal protein S27AE